MGFFRAIKNFFGFKNSAERIHELAAEVMRYADRYANAKKYKSAALARDYAERIAKVSSLPEANRLYAEFLALVRKQETIKHSHSERQDYERDDVETNEENDDDDATEDWSDDS